MDNVQPLEGAVAVISQDDFDEKWEPFSELPDESLTHTFAEVKKYPRNQVWSLVDGDDGGIYAIPDYHVVNVFGYCVTKKAWDHDMYEAVWHTAEEMES